MLPDLPQALLARIADGVFRLDGEGRIVESNPAARELIRVGEADSTGRPFLDFVEPRDRPRMSEALRAAAAGEPRTLTLTLGGFSGECISASLVAVDAPGGAAHMLVIAHAREPHDAREEAAHFHGLVDAAPIGIFYADPDGAGGWVNGHLAEIIGTGPEGARDSGWACSVHPEDHDRVWAAWMDHVHHDGPFALEFRFVQPTGTIRWVHACARPRRDERGEVLGFVGVVTDITAQKEAGRLSAAVAQEASEKRRLEALGRLAGGVAHDFNNLLTISGGTTRLLLERRDLPPEMRADLETIAEVGQRGARLTRQLLAFGRRQVMQPESLSLREVICALAELLERTLPEDVRLVLDLPETLAWVRVDRSQLEQVLLNLITNAADAMPDGGRITVRAFDPTTPECPSVQPFIGFSIVDTGEGMDAETLDRVFEPFFTTKEFGRGFGLGLATVHGIVTQSGGSISVESAPGRGTTFTVLLPRAADAPPAIAPIESENGDRSGELILVVEDEPGVRTVISRMLELRGHRVLLASTGAEALAHARAHGSAIGLLLTDVVLGESSGPEVANRVRAMLPELRVVFMSGYADSAVIPRGAMADGIPLLRKPFTAAELTGILERARA